MGPSPVRGVGMILKKSAALPRSLGSPSYASFSIAAGLVLANDSERRRCHLLVHQTKRLQSPTFMIINHDASVLPAMKYVTEVR